MNTYSTYRRLRWARRISQAAFLLFFIVLLLHTNFVNPSTAPSASSPKLPVGFFLEIDPLNAIASLLSTHVLYRNLLWALALIVATIFFGRFFCGWVCPMGTINQAVSHLNRRARKKRQTIEANRYRPYQKWKYIILLVFLGASLFTSLHVGLMDPIALLSRSMALVVVPAYNVTLQAMIGAISTVGGGFLEAPLSLIGTVLHVLTTRGDPAVYQDALLIGAIFIGILVANRFITRFWCRGLCPLGALLGVFARFSIFGLHKHESNCTQCGLCALECQGGDDPQPGRVWQQQECHLCLNCVGSCPEMGLEFRFNPSRKETAVAPDIPRRMVLASLATGAAMVPIMRATPLLGRGNDPGLVRPPGAVEERDFLARCIRCGECMNVCPNNALHPTFLQAGLEGVWSPVLIPRIGYCDPSCVQCSHICPTGAIDEIAETEKAWVPMKGQAKTAGPPIRIGTAFYDLGRCLPWAMATQCIVCEEWCPVSPKAIWFEEVEVVNREGDLVQLKRPHVDPSLCVGCGACSYACPVKGEPAIVVRSVGETRNPANTIVLEKTSSPAT